MARNPLAREGRDAFELMRHLARGGSLEHPLFRASDALAQGNWVPALDLRETPEAFEVTLELPGVRAEEVDVSYDAGTLLLRGEKRQERHETEQGGAVRRVERSYGKFERALRVTAPVDPERISAELVDGVLTVTLPKAEEARPRQIAVRASGAEEA